MATIKSIEEKTKAYDIALKKIEMLLGSGDSCSREELEYVFPELRESEDERIMKRLLEYFKSFTSETFFNGVPTNDAIAWLEAQGELVNSLSKGLDNAHKRIDGLIQKNNSLIEQLEKKPAEWTEEDKELMKWSINNLTELKDRFGEKYGKVGDCINWLKSLKDRVQPRQEWSEHTQQWIDTIIKDYEEWYDADIDHRATIQIKINILKSLKDRYTWKPSDEQMRVLNLAIRCGINRGTAEETTLISLFDDLKKLK